MISLGVDMNKMQLTTTSLLCLLLLSIKAIGQAEPSDNFAPAQPAQDAGPSVMYVGPLPPPPTKLEAFAAQKGVVIVRGYTRVGDIAGDFGSSLRISAVEMGDPSGQDKVRGLAIQVRETRNGVERVAFSYIDEAEIDPLLAAVESLAKLGPDSTKLTDFGATYRTNGALEVTNVDANGARAAGIRSTQVFGPSGQVVWASAYFRIGRLAEVHQMIDAAKKALMKPTSPAE
jgi:hypothetical protein